MHPIKSPEAIFAAYYTHDVRSFVLDCRGELDKIMQTLPEAQDLELFVRIGLSGGNVAKDFSTKFGAKLDDAVSLLKACRLRYKSLGVSFHVGTQLYRSRNLWYYHTLRSKSCGKKRSNY